MTVNKIKVPEELKARKQWVLWKSVMRDGRETKLPFQLTGEMAKSNDPATWAAFEKAFSKSLLGVWEGVGYVFSESDPYCGIDLDGCRQEETGEISEWAKEIILGFKSYSEISPSKTGVKIWIRGRWKGDGHKQPIMKAPRVCEKEPAIEIYDTLRYFTVTGDRLAECNDILDGQAYLDGLQSKFWPVATPPAPKATAFASEDAICGRARKYLAKLPIAISGQGGHNATFHAACVLCVGFGLSRTDAFGLLSEWNQGCQPPWTEKELNHKLDDAMKQSGERNYLRNVSPQNFDKVQVPAYKAPTPVKPQGNITTLKDAATRYVESIRGGNNSLISLGLAELDYAIGGGVEAGELVLLAARPSHGKSAVALQMVHYWTANELPCAFISEEMSAMAIGKRAVQFATDVPQEHWFNRIEAVDEDVQIHFHNRANCIVIENCRTSENAAEAIRQAKRDHDVKCVIVDYAQLLGSPGKSRYEQVTNTSICLKQIVSETGVLLVALCQLSRSIEQRDKFIPHMSDLKETGQLEQDADVIIFGVWPHRIDSENKPHEYQFFIAKNRNRAINQPGLTCRFNPSRQLFTESTSGQDVSAYSEALKDF